MNRRMAFAAIAAVAMAGGAEGRRPPSKSAVCEYVCRTCGKTTYYGKPGAEIERFRKGCAAC